MRNLSTPANNAGARRPSSSGLGTPLASPNQARYKGKIFEEKVMFSKRQFHEIFSYRNYFHTRPC